VRLPRLRRPAAPSRVDEIAKAERDILEKARRLLRLEAEAGVPAQPFFLRERRRQNRT
jgi:hypothetical protein